ncbi:MAG TPA: 2-amino-4-hydroxy-6-hydroxymethyldihydropteridine diphosphokinase [Xanthomonadales bacterium]|nr:2-amino-4-hydroxy-6-hydroxymethyldihydropteridine diphosphokinase [Xanthomonadales bacterium]
MSTAYLGVGSNIDARKNIASGIAALRERFARIRISPAYRSAAVGFDGNDFINLAVAVETDMGPLELREFLHALEDRHGRARNVPKFSDRTLDVDILLYDDLYLISPLLEIPRDEILSAAHVLKPLVDLAPELRHPATRQTMSRLWAAFPLRDAALELIEL